MSISIYKYILAISLFILATLIGIHLFLNGKIKNTMTLQKEIENSSFTKEYNHKTSKTYNYLEVLGLICMEDGIQLSKLERNTRLSNIIKADIKVFGEIKKLDEILNWITTLSDAIDINRIYIKEENGVKSSILSLDLTDVK